jgi:hypothetical protein
MAVDPQDRSNGNTRIALGILAALIVVVAVYFVALRPTSIGDSASVPPPAPPSAAVVPGAAAPVPVEPKVTVDPGGAPPS